MIELLGAILVIALFVATLTGLVFAFIMFSWAIFEVVKEVTKKKES